MLQLNLSYGKVKKGRTKRRRQVHAATHYEKSPRHQDPEVAVKKVGHTNDRKKGGRRPRWEAPVTPESLAAWLAEETQEIGL